MNDATAASIRKVATRIPKGATFVVSSNTSKTTYLHNYITKCFANTVVIVASSMMQQGNDFALKTFFWIYLKLLQFFDIINYCLSVSISWSHLFLVLTFFELVACFNERFFKKSAHWIFGILKFCLKNLIYLMSVEFKIFS